MQQTWGNESLDDSSTFSGFRSQCTMHRGLACKYCSALSIWWTHSGLHWIQNQVEIRIQTFSSSLCKLRQKQKVTCNVLLLTSNCTPGLLLAINKVLKISYYGYRQHTTSIAVQFSLDNDNKVHRNISKPVQWEILWYVHLIDLSDLTKSYPACRPLVSPLLHKSAITQTTQVQKMRILTIFCAEKHWHTR